MKRSNYEKRIFLGPYTRLISVFYYTIEISDLKFLKDIKSKIECDT